LLLFLVSSAREVFRTGTTCISIVYSFILLDKNYSHWWFCSLWDGFGLHGASRRLDDERMDWCALDCHWNRFSRDRSGWCWWYSRVVTISSFTFFIPVRSKIESVAFSFLIKSFQVNVHPRVARPMAFVERDGYDFETRRNSMDDGSIDAAQSLLAATVRRSLGLNMCLLLLI